MNTTKFINPKSLITMEVLLGGTDWQPYLPWNMYAGYCLNRKYANKLDLRARRLTTELNRN